MNDNKNDWEEQSNERCKSNCRQDMRKLVTYAINTFDDPSGSFANLLQGFSIIITSGTLLGILMPNDNSLPHSWYRLLSSIIGYIYFMSWSVAYYPQVITNHRRKSVSGLSTDYALLTTLDGVCYTIYNCVFYWNDGIRHEFKEKTGGRPLTVESNDVAYSIHALLIAIVQLLQVAYYGGFRSSPISKPVIVLITVLTLVCAIYSVACIHPIQTFGIVGDWIDLLYLLAFIKILLCTVSYIPQLLLNYQRKSTVGFNIWAIILDFFGGSLSMLQLLLDSFDLHDFKGGIMGNWAKLLLGIVTLLLDTGFFVQHYILYRDNDKLENETTNNDKLYKELAINEKYCYEEEKKEDELQKYGAC